MPDSSANVGVFTALRNLLPGGGKSVCAGTVVAHHRLPFARVLADSFARYHPQIEFSILVLDADEDQPRECGTAKLLRLSDVLRDSGDAERWPLLYDEAQLIALGRPKLLQHLLETGASEVIYLEPDAWIFAPFVRGLEPQEALLAAGTPRGNNAPPLTWIRVRAGAETFLADWSRDLQETDALGRKDEGIDADLRLSERIKRQVPEPETTIGFWNIAEHELLPASAGYRIDRHPLQLFHFAGYNPAQPHLLSSWQGISPGILLSEHPALASLCAEYQEALRSAAAQVSAPDTFQFSQLPSGLPINGTMQRLYCEAHLAAEKGAGETPPYPFAAGGEAQFLAWLNQPPTAECSSISRYMLALYEARPDLRREFPDPQGADAEALAGWFHNYGLNELQLPERLLPPNFRANVVGDAASLVHHPVNVVGYLRAELGMGEAGRLLVAAVEAGGIPVNTVTYEATSSRQLHPLPREGGKTASADINLLCLNAAELPTFRSVTSDEFFVGRYNIGDWSWEAEDFPAEYHGAFGLVDEVWVESEYMRLALAKVSPKPVYKFTLPIVAPETNSALDRSHFDLPAGFLFLFSFDFFSVIDRKNPTGLIEAFCRAFRPNEGPVLVIKTINGDRRIREIEQVRYAARGRSDIELRDGYLSAFEKNTLTSLCDCYVSLHRAEGYGLTMAEAMALARPVIATGYSGNLEFMTEENSYLCRSERCAVGPGRQPYPPESTWSEPDLADAARLMRHVFENQSEAAARGRFAAADVLARFSLEEAGKSVRDRIVKIRRRQQAAMGRPQPSAAYYEDLIEVLRAENAALRERLKLAD